MFIENDRIALRPLEKEDLAQAKDWRNDPVVREATQFREYRPLSMMNQEKWFESLGDRNIMFAIIEQIHQKLIGVCGLCYIDMHNRNAEISWYIGRREFMLKGYDCEVVDLLLNYGFNEVGLHRIYAECYEAARERLKILELCGFEREGTLKEVVFRHGTWGNSIMLAVLSCK